MSTTRDPGHGALKAGAVDLGALAARVPYFVRVVLVTAIYFGASFIVPKFDAPLLSMVWIPSGIGIAILLLFGKDLWPGIFLGAFLAFVAPWGVLYSSGVGVGYSLQAVVGAFLLRRATGFKGTLVRVNDVLRLTFFGAAVSTLISVSVSLLAAYLTGPWPGWPQSSYLSVGLRWWAGDAVGVVVAAPLILTWATGRRIAFEPRRFLEAAVLVFVLVSVSQGIYGGWLAAELAGPLTFAIFPPIVWAALRFGQRGVVTMTSLGTGLALWGILHGVGPFALAETGFRAFYLQGFIVIVTVTAMILSAVITERREYAQELRRSRARLKLIHRINVGVTSGASVDQVIERAVESLGEHFSDLRVAYSTIDERGRMRVVASGEAPAMLSLAGATADLSAAPECLETLRQGRPVLASDTRRDSSLQQLAEGMERAGTRATLLVPVMEVSRLVGLLSLDAAARRRWSAHELSAITEVAEGLSVAMREAHEREEQDRAVRALAASEDRLRQMAENINEVFWLSEWPSDRVIFVSPVYEKVWGRSVQLLLGNPSDWINGIHEDDRDRVSRSYFSKAGEGLYDEEFRVVRPDGAMRWVRDRGFPIRDDGGKVYRIAGIAEDFTARREAENEIRRLNDDLEQRVVERTEELEAANRELEGFAYSVAHDLRAPLRAINGFLNILLDDLGERLDDDAQGYLRAACKSTVRMDSLINDLLAFSQVSRQTLQRLPVRPTALVHEALRDLSHLTKDREIDLTVDDLPPCRADRTLLKQVFANLLGNSLKFTREGVVPTIHVGYDISGGEPIFFVRDNGIGFDMRHADKLFGVFQRLHRSDEYEGTGVGLALTQRIVERHGGRLWAEAEEGRGATFYFSLGSQPGDWTSVPKRSRSRSQRRRRVDESVRARPSTDTTPREEA